MSAFSDSDTPTLPHTDTPFCNPRQRDHGLDGCFAQPLVGLVEVFADDVRQLPLPPQRDQPQRRQPQLDAFAASALAQGVVKRLHVVEHVALEVFGELVVQLDHPAKPARRLPPQQRPQRHAPLALGSQTQRLEQRLIGGLVLRTDQCTDQAREHLLRVIGRSGPPA
jgi:hypothetical protein